MNGSESDDQSTLNVEHGIWGDIAEKLMTFWLVMIKTRLPFGIYFIIFHVV